MANYEFIKTILKLTTGFVLGLFACLHTTHLQSQGIFSGGNGDGFAFIGYSQQSYAQIEAIFNGGNEDGYAFTGYSQQNYAQIQAIFNGGNEDGYAFAGYSQQSYAQIQAIFNGGNEDGFGSQSLPSGPIDYAFWSGNTSTDFNTGSNWVSGLVPVAGANIAFLPTASHNMILDQNRNIGDLDFNGAGKQVELANFNLNVAGNIYNASNTQYIKTPSIGLLKRNIAVGQSLTFPVGNSAYNPVTISNNNLADDDFSVRVLDEVYYKGTWGLVAVEPRVQRTWIIDKTGVNTGSGLNFAFNWNNGEATAGLNSPSLYAYDGTQWQSQTGTTSSTATSLTYIGYTGNSDIFSIGDQIVLLPITWLSVNCDERNNNNALIRWSTAQESQTRQFVVERNDGNGDFYSIDSLPAAGFSQSVRYYQIADSKPRTKNTYYRVRMEAISGNQNAISSVCHSTETEITPLSPVKIYPNPTESNLHIIALEPERNFTFTIYCAAGRAVRKGESSDGKAMANLNDLSEGIYYLTLSGNGIHENHRVLLVK
jgi:hypothetical protein